MEWTAIIEDNALKSKVENKIDEIANCLERAYKKHNAIGLADGKAGIILFFCYYNSFRKTDKYSSIIIDFITEVEETLKQSDSLGLNYASGYAGVFWLLNFLKTDFIDIEELPIKLYEPFYDYSLNKIRKDKDLDFLNGPIGLFYFLNEYDCKKEILLTIINEIKKAGIENDVTFSPPIIKVNSLGIEVINLSLSHGISSIIIVLCRFYKKHNDIRVKELIIKSCNYLKSVKYPDNKYISLYPSWIEIDTAYEVEYGSRLSWCYGDLGNALAFHEAGLILNDTSLLNEALDIFKFNTKRRGFNETNIKDAEFCHGSSGVAHIYNRLFHKTSIPEFKETALFWYNKTIEFSLHDNLCAGYKMQKQGAYVEDYTLFEGISGVGLSLISAVSNIEPKWDKCILLS